MSTFLIIDASAVLHRAYHALPPFKAPNGTPTNAVYGFVKMLFSLINKLNPDYLAVCFDTAVPSFRKKLLSTYQAQRPKADDEYRVQIPLAIEFISKSEIAAFSKEGYEADDVIATIGYKIQKLDSDIKVFIVTGDKDLLQLVNKQVTVIMPKKGVSEVDFLDEAGVFQKLGIKPNELTSYKALVGDSSDNYKGVTGIGPKKTQQLIGKYQTLANIYNHLDELDNKTRDLLINNKNEALLSEKLAILVPNVEIEFDFDKCFFVFSKLKEKPDLITFFEQLGLRSLKQQLIANSKKTVTIDNRSKKEKEDQLNFF